ncbi:MAG: ParB N-terminal domain-containing protein [Anaerolineales bacterium]|nr:ParB N-terminal domain-containing protein [Anaerolineales bacterium]
MRDSSFLPNLQIQPSALMVPHEDVDPRRVEKLSTRLLEEGILKNPVLVAPIPDSERFVVLDGANRTSAFQLLGIPHIVVQVVRYDDPQAGVVLDTWYHVVAGMSLEEFETALTQVANMRLEPASLVEARQALEDKETAAYIICEGGVRKVYSLSGRHPPDLKLLVDLVGAYRGRAEIFRASNDIWEIQKPYYPHIAALVVFPRLRPEDIIYAAQNGEKVPSGITRHIIPARALNINIPIGILMSEWTLERKREWLGEWLMGRMGANAIRYYAESTFSFNE